jgi:hypothetical protein
MIINIINIIKNTNISGLNKLVNNIKYIKILI